MNPDKENDVVARAKLDAKKKFGSNPSTEPVLSANGQVEKPSPADEKESYIRRRIRNDFTRLMYRQTKVFADDIAKLEPFQVGFSTKCFPTTNLASGSDSNLVTAGRLLLNVLPALAEKEVSRASQLAADDLIQALESVSVPHVSFFDAIAILAESKDILVGTDRILAQLFSRSASSGNSKALRTSSGAESKLFATTNGPFIIYNTIENTESTAAPSSRHSNRSLATAIPAAARSSPRERRPTAKMLGINEVSTRQKSRTSVSPRTSPPKVPKLTRPSKLRGSVSFAKSPSPLPKRVKLTDVLNSDVHEPDHSESASNAMYQRQQRSMNQYRPKQAAPGTAGSSNRADHQIEINNDLVRNLLDLATMASQQDTDDDSALDNLDSSAPPIIPRSELPVSPQPAVPAVDDDTSPGNLQVSSKAAAHESTQPLLPNSMIVPSPEEVAKFLRIIEQLPESEAHLSHDEIDKIAKLYDQLVQGPSFNKAKAAGLSYPEIPRPYADKDGWKLTGVTNEFGEEIVEVDPKAWIYPRGYAGESQQPLQRLKRKAHAVLESIFGFPPAAGYGNGPRHKRQRVEEENVAYEKLMFDVRKAAEVRGLPCDKNLSWEQLAESIKGFDAAHGITFEQPPADPVIEPVHDEPEDEASSHADVSEVSDVGNDDDSDYEPDQAIQEPEAEVWTGVNGAQMSSFSATNNRKDSLRQLRDRPSTTTTAQGSQNRRMDISAILDVSENSTTSQDRLMTHQAPPADMSPPLRTTASSPSTSIRYDIRPPSTSGTFNTFNGPITSSNTPTATPTGTPSFMKLNFNNPPRKQPSTSPAPSHISATASRPRRPSTPASASTSVSPSSFASRPPSTQPLDIDNTTAYNVSKGYLPHSTATNTNTTSSSAQSHSAPGSPVTTVNGLNGGFPGGGIIINAPDKRGDGRGQRRKSKAPDFKMTVAKAARDGPRVQAKAVRGGTVLKFG